MGTLALLALAGLADDKVQGQSLDLADGQGWIRAILTALFIPQPDPEGPPGPPAGRQSLCHHLQPLPCHLQPVTDAGGEASGASCAPTDSLSILSWWREGTRVQLTAAHPLQPDSLALGAGKEWQVTGPPAGTEGNSFAKVSCCSPT